MENDYVCDRCGRDLGGCHHVTEEDYRTVPRFVWDAENRLLARWVFGMVLAVSGLLAWVYIQ
jgi:hypothetical protein